MNEILIDVRPEEVGEDVLTSCKRCGKWYSICGRKLPIMLFRAEKHGQTEGVAVVDLCPACQDALELWLRPIR